MHQSVKDPNDWPLEGRRPDVGSVFWYGRAELKQSDHRPILGIFDVEVLRLETDKREEIFEEALTGIGPPDGSVLLQVYYSDVKLCERISTDIVSLAQILLLWFMLKRF